MNPFELRPYQRDCVEAVLSKFREYRRLLAVVPTAGGKRIVFSPLAQRPVRSRALPRATGLVASASTPQPAAAPLAATA